MDSPEEKCVYRSSKTNKYIIVERVENTIIIYKRCDKDGVITDDTERNYTQRQWEKEGFVKVTTNNKNEDKGGEEDTPGTHKLFSIVINEDGRLIVKDKDGLPVLDMGDIRGPKGDDGYVDPIIKEGKLYFRNKKGDIFTSGGNVKGEDGVSYEPVLDEQTGQLRFKNSKTGELRPGGFDIKGKDGENGKTFEPRVTPDGKYLFFVDGDGKEIPGQYLIKGKDGENGKKYIPHISDDGTELFFTDGEGVEIPGRYPVKGAEGQPGVAFYPEVDEDGYLSWHKVDGETILNNPPTPKKIKGEQGEPGITYKPFVKDGVLYWCDDKGNLVDDLDPARIKGDRGETGKEGPRGLSAYQIWRKQGYRGTEQDFLEFLKGEKGEPAPPANFSFKDVEDWTCPVQKIDTNLIVDSEKGTDSPEKIIEDRIKDIDDVRELGKERRKNSLFENWFNWSCILFLLGGLCIAIGVVTDKSWMWIPAVVLSACFLASAIVSHLLEKKKNKQKKCGKESEKGNSDKTSKANRIGLLKEFAWWCAGADKDLLAMCPGDHTKYVGIGTVILFTALMAWFSSFIAMQLVFDPVSIKNGIHLFGKTITEIPLWSVIFATFWSAMIFCLDRFITNTMYSDGKVTISRKEFMSGLPRIIIAIFLGIVISTPLELKIFKKEIDDKFRQEFLVSCDSLIKNDPKYSKEEEELKVLKTSYDMKKHDAEYFSDKSNAGDAYFKDVHGSFEGSNSSVETGNYKKDPEGNLMLDKKGNPIPLRRNTKEYVVTNDKVFDTLLWNNDKKNAENAEETAQDKYLAKVQYLASVRDTLIGKYKHRDTINSMLKSKGLYERIHVMHEMAMDGYKPWFYKDKPAEQDNLAQTNDSVGAQKTDVLHDMPQQDVVYSSEIVFNSVENSDSIHGAIVEVLHKKLNDTIQSSININKDENEQSENVQVNNKKDKKDKEYLYGAENHKFLAFLDTILHKWWWFLLSSPIGLIMLLFILIDISPVLYKMMLADGKYDNYLHQEKLLAQDKIRLSLAKMLKKLDDGELKRVSPFIMGDAYGKMAKEAYSYVNVEKENAKEQAKKSAEFMVREDYAKYYNLLMKEYQEHNGWRRVFPLSLFEWFVVKKKEEPLPPRIEFEKNESVDPQKGPSETNTNSENSSEPAKPNENKSSEDTSIEKMLEATNREVFQDVLDMKKKIILASYRRWYKTQHDCIICDDIEDENKGCEPFDDEAREGDDTKIHIDEDGKDKERFNHDDFTINTDTGDEEESSQSDDNVSNGKTEDSSQVNNDDDDTNEEKKKKEEEKAEDKDEGAEKEEMKEETQEEDDGSDPDEQELPNDDGDDFPNE